MALIPVNQTIHPGELNALDIVPIGWERIDDDVKSFPLNGWKKTFLFMYEDFSDFDYNDLGLVCNFKDGCVKFAQYSAAQHTWTILGNEDNWYVEVYPSNFPGIETVVSSRTIVDREIAFGQRVNEVPEVGSIVLLGTAIILSVILGKKHVYKRTPNSEA